MPASIDGRLGHAWFARTGTSLQVARAAPLPAVMRDAEQALASASRSCGRRATRIPADSFVSVRSRPSAPAPTHPLRLAAPAPKVGANDNPKPGPTRLTRCLVVVRGLTLLAAALAGIYHLGRTNAFYRVISLPDIERPGTRVT